MATQILGELREYNAAVNSSRPSTGFIDLATYDNVEKAMYGGKRSITYFMRETVRSNWFAQIPIQMRNSEDDTGFGKNFTVTVSREGDYLMNTWLRVSLMGVSIYCPSDGNYTDPVGKGAETLTWTPNFMHNLVESCVLKVNGMVVDELYSEHLDFLSAFTVPKSSRIGYNRMIGNFNSPFKGMGGVNVSGYPAFKFPNLNWQQELYLPLPFFYSKATGLALPLASLPYNDIKIEFKFREWKQLLASVNTDCSIVPVNASQITTEFGYEEPRIENIQVWGNYAVVTEQERQKIGCMTRDMVIEQNQQLGGSYGSGNLEVDSLTSPTKIDLRLSGAVKSIFFAARNSSGSSAIPYRSNYTTSCPSASDITVCKISVSGSTISAKTTNSANAASTAPLNINLNYDNLNTNDRSGLVWNTTVADPIGSAKILYENDIRMNMEAMYYSLIQPYQHARNVPDSSAMRGIMSLANPNEVSGQPALSIGYHMYSYALSLKNTHPNGSTNFGELANASLVLRPSTSAVNNISKGQGPWRVFVGAINQNVLRISKGAMNFPIL